MTLRVKSQTRHQHQRIPVAGNRFIRHRLRDACIALGDLGQIIQINELHLIAVNLWNSHTLAIPQCLLQHRDRADFLIVRKIAVDHIRLAVGIGLHQKLTQSGAFLFNFRFCHGALLLTDHGAQFLFIHWAAPLFSLLQAGTSGTRGK